MGLARGLSLVQATIFEHLFTYGTPPFRTTKNISTYDILCMYNVICVSSTNVAKHKTQTHIQTNDKKLYITEYNHL